MPVRIPIESMSKACQEAARKARAESLPKVKVPEHSVLASSRKKPGIRVPKKRVMNKGEREYQAILSREFPGCIVEYEKWTIHLNSGTSYRPDFVVREGYNKWRCAVEVKGSYRLKSAGLSHEKFKQAVAEFPGIPFRYAKRNKEGGWSVTELNTNQQGIEG